MKRLLKPAASLVAATCLMLPAPAGSDVNPGPRATHSVRLSAAAERMLRERLEAGETVPGWMIRRFGLDVPELPAADTTPATLAPGTPGLLGPAPALGPDAQVNDKSGDTSCPTCSGRPLGQAETTIAAFADLMVAGWNDTKGFCTGGAVQGYATSIDGGATWIDHGDVPAVAGGGRYRGDPIHGVDRKTGAFYICGLYEGGALGSGLALLRGHFAGGAFVIDDNRQIAVGGADFLDKEWFAVDSLSGNLYVTYTRFTPATSWIEFIRSTDNGLTWSTPIVMNAPAANDLVQGSRPAVGPDGELYVVWYEFGVPQSHMRIRRSDDFGASFGPEQTVCDFYENYWSGAPGFRRPFGIALPGIAVDASDGPYRGRAYVTWDESVNFLDAPFASLTAQVEDEPNGNFAQATPFAVGDILRGGMPAGTDVDLFRFAGVQGQTVTLRADSVSSAANLLMRIIAPVDTTSFGAYRFLAYTSAQFPTLAFTLPADDMYYLMLTASAGVPVTYVVNTTTDTPSPGERARDHRDRFIAHSDDGTTWSAPVLLNDDDPWFDGTYPEVTVDGTGAAHVFWHDFRDDPYGAESYEYMVSSGDGGATWGPNRRVSDVSSFWSFETCGSANQGDYQGITSDGDVVVPCWSDARLGDPDVYTDAIRFAHTGGCPAPVLGPAGSVQMISFDLENTGSAEGTFAWTVEDDLGWLTGAVPGVTGSSALAAGATQNVTATVQVPAACSPSVDHVRFIAADPAIPGRSDTCETTVYCVSATGVADGAAFTLSLAPPRPNPGTGPFVCAFALSRPGAVRLEVFDAAGARVRTLATGTWAAGAHEVAWDARNARGSKLGAGVYIVQLDAGGRTLRRRLILIR